MVERPTSRSDPLNCLEEEFEQQHASEGYETGFELGKKDGYEEGYSRGLLEGVKRGSEVGFYRGYTMTWIKLLQLDPTLSTKSTKAITTLNEVMQLVDEFPKTNETFCEERLSKIRVKFKQSTSLLNIKV